MVDFITRYWAAIGMGLVAVVALRWVVKGSDTKPDGTNNKARGGGPDVPGSML